MEDNNYKNAYERQKKAREKAEQILESKSRELYDANQSLVSAYNKLRDQKAQILHQEKLASIGQLAAGVAHEINNPASFVKANFGPLNDYVSSLETAIKRYESLLLSDQKNMGPMTDEVAEIRNDCDLAFILTDIKSLISESTEGLNRIGNIVQSLKNFARPDSKDDQVFSLNACIDNTLRLVHNEIKHNAELVLELDDIPDIKGKAGEIGQVILNLIVNACDAIEHAEGKIDIHTSFEKNEIRMDVSDNGPGIPQNLITRIFDPFFTTKDVGKGTGLGLSISYKIVKNHGGRIAVNSQEGCGTTFSLFFPAHESNTG